MLFHIFQNPQYEHMARKERVSKGRTMMPNYFVFCEGDTEVAYIEMLRSFYRLPIHISTVYRLIDDLESLRGSKGQGTGT